MASNDRAQWARLDIDGVGLLADLAAPLSLARPVQFESEALRCFGAAAPASVPMRAGHFSGSVDTGAGCNCRVITLTPHANGTHTECVGHLTREPLHAFRLIPTRLLVAVLLTLDPEPDPADLHARPITRESVLRAWPAPLSERLRARAAILRTRPNPRDKFLATAAPQAVPYLSADAASELVSRGISHLVLDTPSADRLEDGGALVAHRIFFGLPAGSHTLAEAQRRDCTITELAYIEDTIADGWYLLSLQAPAVEGDAVPSRPLLYALRAT
jgi:kynurenine formamidase